MAALGNDIIGHFEDLLTCTICLEVFKVPKYLPCLHTFCEYCISTYISSCLEKDSDMKEFKCPVCKRSVVKDETIGLPSKWANSLPLNHLVMSMLDKHAITKSEKLCNSCELNLETVKAVSWCTVCEEGLCKTCEKCHKSFKMTSSHLIVSLEETNCDKTIVTSKWLNCEYHVGKIVEVYCIDHSTPCCTLCVSLSHRKCETVVSIDCAASGVKKSIKAKDLSKSLQEKSTKIQKLIANKEENIRIFESESSKILSNIDAVVQHLNEASDKVREHVMSSKKKAVISLTDEITELSNFKSTVDNWKSILETCIQHGSDQQCLVEMEKIMFKNSEQNREMNKYATVWNNLSLTFEMNKILPEFKRSAQTLLKLFEDLPAVNFRSGNIKVLKTIEVDKISRVNTSRNISGIFVGDLIVLTDRVNKRIVKYNASYVYLSELSLPKEVSDITHIEQDAVGVASKQSNEIYVINITNMTLTKTIKTANKLYGLQSVEGGFITAYHETLTWMSTSGSTLNKIKTNGDTWYVCAQRDMYIFSDGINAVSSFNADASLSFRYRSTNLGNARGIDVDFEGNIYIVGHSSGNIHQISDEGRLIRIFSTWEYGINQPWVLRFKPNSATFLLTSSDKSGKVLICKFE